MHDTVSDQYVCVCHVSGEVLGRGGTPEEAEAEARAKLARDGIQVVESEQDLYRGPASARRQWTGHMFTWPEAREEP